MPMRRRWALSVVLLLGACGAPAKHPVAIRRTTTASVTTAAPSASSTTDAPARHAAPATPTTAAPRADLPPLPADAPVRVALAPVWHTPSSPRAMDRLALGAPVDIRGWLAPMTTKQREDVTDRVDTQTLLG